MTTLLGTQTQPRATAAGTPDPSPSLWLRTRFDLAIDGIQRAVISAPAIVEGELASKDLLAVGNVASNGKYTLEEHCQRLVAQNSIPLEMPVLAIGLRNSIVNGRAVLAINGRSWGADGEDPSRSARPYFGLAWRDGHMTMERALGPRGWPLGVPDFFVAGMPVLWDNLDGDALWDALLTESADHSHLFSIHRGKHPQASDRSRAAWQQLHEVFLEHLYSEAEKASSAMRRAVDALPRHFRRRCTTYFHAVLGVDGDGRFVYIAAHGLLEELGQYAAAVGCRRAICVENSGSVMPTLFPRGVGGPAVPLLRAPNFRPKGRVLLFLGLANDAFDVLPDKTTP